MDERSSPLELTLAEVAMGRCTPTAITDWLAGGEAPAITGDMHREKFLIDLINEFRTKANEFMKTLSPPPVVTSSQQKNDHEKPSRNRVKPTPVPHPKPEEKVPRVTESDFPVLSASGSSAPPKKQGQAQGGKKRVAPIPVTSPINPTTPLTLSKEPPPIQLAKNIGPQKIQQLENRLSQPTAPPVNAGNTGKVENTGSGKRITPTNLAPTPIAQASGVWGTGASSSLASRLQPGNPNLISPGNVKNQEQGIGNPNLDKGKSQTDFKPSKPLADALKARMKGGATPSPKLVSANQTSAWGKPAQSQPVVKPTTQQPVIATSDKQPIVSHQKAAPNAGSDKEPTVAQKKATPNRISPTNLSQPISLSPVTSSAFLAEKSPLSSNQSQAGVEGSADEKNRTLSSKESVLGNENAGSENATKAGGEEGMLPEGNADGRAEDQFAPSLEKVSNGAAVTSLAHLFGALWANHIVPSVASDLRLLVHLLTAPQTVSVTFTPHPAWPMFTSHSNCMLFAAKSLECLKPLLCSLDRLTIGRLSTNQRLCIFAPNLVEDLRRVLAAPPLVGLSVGSDMAGGVSKLQNISMSFNPKADQGAETTTIGHNREKCRDSFQLLLRDWEYQTPIGTATAPSPVHGQGQARADLVASTQAGVQQLLSLLMRCNYPWFAALFVRTLLRNSLAAAMATDQGGDQSKDVIVRLQREDPARLHKLNKRFAQASTDSSQPPPQPQRDLLPPTYGDFFSTFITSADNHTLCVHLRSALWSQLDSLHDFAYAGPSSLRDFEERLLALRVLGRYLGLLAFYPYSSLSQFATREALTPTTIKELVEPIHKHLHKSLQFGHLVLTLPWVCEYFAAASEHVISVIASDEPQVLNVLSQVYRAASSPSNKSLICPRASTLMTFVVGSFLETLPVRSLTNDTPVGNQPTQGQDMVLCVDRVQELVSDHLLLTLVPLLGDIQSVLYEATNPVDGSTRIALPNRKIKPMETPGAAKGAGSNMDRELQRWFFLSHPQLKQVAEFITDRVAPQTFDRTLPRASELQGTALTRLRVLFHDVGASHHQLPSDPSEGFQMLFERTREPVSKLLGEARDMLVEEAEVQARDYGESKTRKAMTLLTDGDLSVQTIEIAIRLATDRLSAMVSDLAVRYFELSLSPPITAAQEKYCRFLANRKSDDEKANLPAPPANSMGAVSAHLAMSRLMERSDQSSAPVKTRPPIEKEPPSGVTVRKRVTPQPVDSSGGHMEGGQKAETVTGGDGGSTSNLDALGVSFDTVLTGIQVWAEETSTGEADSPEKLGQLLEQATLLIMALNRTQKRRLAIATVDAAFWLSLAPGLEEIFSTNQTTGSSAWSKVIGQLWNLWNAISSAPQGVSLPISGLLLPQRVIPTVVALVKESARPGGLKGLGNLLAWVVREGLESAKVVEGCVVGLLAGAPALAMARVCSPQHMQDINVLIGGMAITMATEYRKSGGHPMDFVQMLAEIWAISKENPRLEAKFHEAGIGDLCFVP